MTLIERLLCKFFDYKDITGNGDLYMRRWFIIGRDDSEEEDLSRRTWRLCLHKVYRSDDHRDAPHNHPFGFLTAVLAGGYNDNIYHWNGVTRSALPTIQNMHPGKIAWRPASHLHQLILKIDPKTGKEIPSWTLVYMTKPTQTWGFVTEAGRYIDRKDYQNEK